MHKYVKNIYEKYLNHFILLVFLYIYIENKQNEEFIIDNKLENVDELIKLLNIIINLINYNIKYKLIKLIN